MLKKILKYDLKFIFKYWSLAAVICALVSVLCGFCVTVLTTERDMPYVVTTTASSAVFLTYIVFLAVAIITFILIFIRFYRNFFSDEGYLTFTLPVKRSTLLNSKIITSLIVSFATTVLITICVCIILLIGVGKDLWDNELWAEIGKFLKLCFSDNLICRIIYVIEGMAIILLSSIFAYLFLFTCITFASIITKKARVITAIGIYFGINFAISFAFQIFAIFGIATITGYFKNIKETLLEPTICLAGLAIILLFAAVCTALYTLLYRMLDRKLNLT